MWKIFFALFICIFISPFHSAGNSLVPINLWQSDQHVIQGFLSQEWEPLSPEEIDSLSSTIPNRTSQQSGEIVSSFKFFSESKRNDSTRNPQVIVFLKKDEYVDEEMIQKTYEWLEKNKNLLSGMLADRVERASVQDIEYKQKLPGILFQNSILVNGQQFTGLSLILFLKSSILNIVCLAEEAEFGEYAPIFRTFLESVVIPPVLQHATVKKNHPTTLLTEIFAFLERKWQLFLGIFLILLIYGWVFQKGREKSITN